MRAVVTIHESRNPKLCHVTIVLIGANGNPMKIDGMNPIRYESLTDEALTALVSFIGYFTRDKFTIDRVAYDPEHYIPYGGTATT